jgi:LemA protein
MIAERLAPPSALRSLPAFLMLVFVLPLLAGCGYNTIPTAEENAKAAWSEVLNQYQRRADLIPNLVETVKGYASHEKDTLDAVVQARAKATQITVTPDTLKDPEALKKFQDAQAGLTSALSRLIAVSEAYPDLKANQNFSELQASLETMESEIQMARRYYNGAARDLNVKVESFPSNLVAGQFGFSKREYFEITNEADRAVPSVKF